MENQMERDPEEYAIEPISEYVMWLAMPIFWVREQRQTGNRHGEPRLHTITFDKGNY